MSPPRKILVGCAANGCSVSQASSRTPYCKMHYWRLKRGSVGGLAATPAACIQCGSQMPRRRRRFCSDICMSRHARGTPSVRACAVCGSSFATSDKTKSCSDVCAVYLKRSHHQARRARRRSQPAESFTSMEIFERDGYRCMICGEMTDREMPPKHPRSPSLDHIIPISRGGAHTRANSQCSHYRCNLRKHATVPVAA